MKAKDVWRETPWVLRVPYLLFGASIVLLWIGVLTQSDQRWLFVPFSLSPLLLGIVLALNVSGAATAVARLMREQRPMGVDFSKSWLATSAYARFLGAGLVLVGAGMLFAVVTQPISEL